jgi:dTDP-4-amino-4,6-dideoxygalactose transaminase
MYSKFATENYPVALELSARGINLPSAPALTDDDLIYIIDLIKQFYIA